jgi:hypothetical protein
MEVVFPAPLGPKSPKMEPEGTEIEMLSTALKLPKDFETFSKEMAVIKNRMTNSNKQKKVKSVAIYHFFGNNQQKTASLGAKE